MKWSIKEAQERLEEVIHAAKTEGPQIITIRGKEVAALISMDEYRELLSQAESSGALEVGFQE